MRRIRLSKDEIIAIKNSAVEVFGKGTKVYLFGSRAYFDKRGGDIDLYIKPHFKDNLLERKIKFLSRLWEKLGEQKIDIILETNSKRPIEKVVLREGVEL